MRLNHQSAGMQRRVSAAQCNPRPMPREYKLFALRTVAPVSYTHLDVYKRQVQQLLQVLVQAPWVRLCVVAHHQIAAWIHDIEHRGAFIGRELREHCLLYTSRCV